MDNTLTECAAVDETVVFLTYFKDLHDPRQQGKVCYPLEEILLLCLLAVVAGAETITERAALSRCLTLGTHRGAAGAPRCSSSA
jgi:DDE_Tnp_1-associated